MSVTGIQYFFNDNFKVLPRDESDIIPAVEPPPDDDDGQDPPPPPGDWLSTSEVPGFSFKVQVTNQSGDEIIGAKDASCIPETVCVSGAVPGRSEVFLRVVGPKPNGYLWPTMAKFSTSQVEIRVRQDSSGEILIAGPE